MNYKILTAIITNFLIVLNSWAGCCFREPTQVSPLHPQTFRCTTIANVGACEGDVDAVAYYDNNASCLDDFICCAQGETAFEFHVKGIEIGVRPLPPGCSEAIILPIYIINFTADLINSYVNLEGTAVAIEDQGFVEIWRAQIRDEIDAIRLDDPIPHHRPKVTNLTMIGRPTPTQEDHVEFPFSATDTNPLSGVNYYVPVDRKTDGEYTAHCDHIQYVVIGEGTPDLDLAISLCKKHKILPLLQIFAP